MIKNEKSCTKIARYKFLSTQNEKLHNDEKRVKLFSNTRKPIGQSRVKKSRV